MTEKPTYEELEQRIKDLENVFEQFKKRHQQLYSNAPVMVHSIDPEGVLLDVSEYWLEKMGYERKDVIGKKSIDFLTEASRQKAIDVYLPEFFKWGHIKDVPYQMIKSNGETIEVLLSAISERNQHNDIIRTFAVCVDISDQMRTERKLRESKKDLKLAQKIGKIGNWSWEIGPDRVEWSDQVYKIFKAPRKEPSYEFAKNFVHPEDLELWEGTVRRAVENQEPFAIDYRAIRSDGEIIWVHNDTESVFNDDGDLIGYIGTIQDITDRKIEEERLDEKEGKYRLLFENAQDAIFIADPDTGTLLDVNKSAEKLTGYNRNELLGKHQTFIHPPEQSDHYAREFMKSARDKSSSFKEMVVRKKNGNDVSVEISSGGTLLGKNHSFHVGFFRDISERKKIVESLAKSESLFRGLYDYMTSGSAIYEVINDGSKGSDYIVKNFNKKSLEIEGKTLDQVVGKSLFDLRPNIDEYGLIPVMKKVWETGEPAYFPVKIYQDATFSNYYENYIFRIPTGEVITIYNDVTEQKNAEITLKNSEERFALAMEFANDGLFDWNLETNEIYYSPVWKRMLGYEDDELPNDFSIWEKLTEAEDVKRSWKMQDELINKKRNNFEIEFKMKHKNGCWIDILSRANAIFNEDNKAIRIVGTHVDITERKQAEMSLLQKKKEAERYLNLAGVMFIGLDRNGNVNVANKKACEVLECTETEIINQNWFDNYIPDRMRNDVRYVFKQLMEGKIKPVEYYENPVLTKSGNEKHVAWNNTVIMDEKGSIIGILGSGEDVTEKLKLQVQLQHAQKMESIGNLAGGIAHDFNNILSSIIGFTEIALDEAPKGTVLEDSLQEVYSAGKRAKDLVRQILAFARQSDVKISPIQLGPIAKEVLKLIRSTIPTTIEIQQEIESDAPILGNATQVHQVLMNLCTNAAYSMEDSGGVLSVSLKDMVLDTKDLLVGMNPGDYVEIKVSDTGVGIAPGIIQSIFEPYFTTKGPGEGTGMGLAMAQGVIESYGGRIAVDSKVGKGTAFTIYLPVAKKRSAQGAYVPEELPTGTGRILFVDDEAPIGKMGGQILERLGYSVTIRTSSIEALELFRTKPNEFDLVVTDMTMPNLTGDKLAIELMKIRPDIPVILCTGYSKKISDEIAAEIGIKAFAYKPVVKADFAKTVRKVLDEVKSKNQA